MAVMEATKPKRFKPLVEKSIRQRLGDVVAMDTEGTGLSPWQGDRPFGFSFCNPAGKKLYISFPVDPFTREVQYAKRPVEARQLAEFLADEEVQKIFWNAKYDVRMCQHAGFLVRGRIEEGMFAAHTCNSEEITYALKPLAKRYCGIDDDDEKDLQKEVVRLRRLAKKAGWKISPDAQADKWLPQEAHRCALIGPHRGAMKKDKCRTYAIRDAERTMVLWLFFSQTMKDLKIRKIYEREMKLWYVTYAMEERGVMVHPPALRKLEEAYTRDSKLNEDELRKVAKKAIKRKKLKLPGKEPFNPNSHKQIAAILYDHLKLPPPRNAYREKKMKSEEAKRRPTHSDALLVLSAKNPFPDRLLKYRASEKALGYLRAYRKAMRKTPEGWLLHADFQQVGPKTGRFACRNPNLQQAPNKQASRAKNPIDTRDAFGPRPGHEWFCLDYSQLEVRVFASLSGEREMMKIIKSGQHIHRACADHVWGGETELAIKSAYQVLGFNRVGTADDSPEMIAARKKFKAKTNEETARKWLESFNWSIVAAESSLDRKNFVNKAKLGIFTRLFGGGVPSIMNLLKCEEAEAREFLKEYADAFPDLEPFIQETTKQARRDGCVWTAFGRRISVDPDFAYRGVNYRVQGSAADLMKRAMMQCHDYLRENDVRGWIVLTIHDELIFEFEKSERKMKHVLKIKELMEDHGGAFKIGMPTEVERVRHKWSEKEKISWAV